MTNEKAELITHICKECQKNGFTIKDLDEVMDKVLDFYEENARP